MSDSELLDLEVRLRASVGRRQAAPPDELLRFIEDVPDRYPRSRLALPMRLPRLRIGVGFAAAAAVVVAIVGATLLVSLRQGQLGGIDQNAPNAGPGWTWQRGDGTEVIGGFRVANGYLGQCSAASMVACTSPDGVHWTIPADPGIASLDGGITDFLPFGGASLGGIYVRTFVLDGGGNTAAAPTSGPSDVLAPQSSASPYNSIFLMRSTDGTHWSRVSSSVVSSIYIQSVDVESGAFTLIGGDGNGTGWVLTSTDGLVWTRASQIPGSTYEQGPAGLFSFDSYTGGRKAWHSWDGKTWTQIELPVETADLVAYSVPGGGYIALDEASAPRNYWILRSADGLNWTVDQGNLAGEPRELVSAGDRLFTIVSQTADSSASGSASDGSGFDAYAIWQSADWGRTWQPLLDGYGHQVSGVPGVLGDLLAISSAPTADLPWSPLEWVGRPPPAATATPTATPGPYDATPSAPLGSSACSTLDPPTSPPVMSEIAGLTGWQEVGRWWSNQPSFGACGTGTDKRSGASIAVIGTCGGSGVLHVSLEDQTAVYELNFPPSPGPNTRRACH
jgi:hypothetical protein